ncbi:MAG: hypothetical protein EAZ95_18425 [Bacteroidetes bacterium]|nr:MAG: hypothetical protein EAZ95_18425 [Bacteroidota bacterium]
MLSFCLFVASWAFAQKPRYVDYKPKYDEWNKRYILDKITYWNDRTVFHFRYAAGKYNGGMTFYGPLSPDKWCLVNIANSSEQFPEIELRKIIREGYTLYNVYQEEQISFSTKPYEIFTVEVHFPALPSHITQVDFLEGVTKRRLTNHFHCLNVKVKPFNDPELGTAEDMQKRVDAFEIRTLGWAKTALNQPKPPKEIAVNTKPSPEEKPKPQPKPQDREAKAQDKEVFDF